MLGSDHRLHVLPESSGIVWIYSPCAEQNGSTGDSNHFSWKHFFLSGPFDHIDPRTSLMGLGKWLRWYTVACEICAVKMPGIRLAIACTMTSASRTFNFATAVQWVKKDCRIIFSLGPSWHTENQRPGITSLLLKLNGRKICKTVYSDLILTRRSSHLSHTWPIYI